MTIFDDHLVDGSDADAAAGGNATGRTTSVPARPIEPTTWFTRHRAAVVFAVSDLAALAATLLVVGSMGWPDLVFAAALVILLAGGGHYRSHFTVSLLDDAPSLVGRSLVAGAITVLVAQVAGASAAIASWTGALTFVAALLAFRAVAYQLVRTLRRRRHIAHRTLILGAGMVGQELAQSMLARPQYGLAPVGFVDDNPLVHGHASAAPILGGEADLARLIDEHGVDQVVIAFTSTTGESMVEIIRTAGRLNCEISVVPRLFELAGRGRDVDEINGVPLNRLRRAPFRSITWPLKRVLDILASGLALVLLSPLLGLIALVLRLTDGPGVIFRQERIGIDGVPFELLKFRSLRPVDADESSTKWNIKHDDRLSPIGKFIRRTSIDELPQLWNIVRGDMSLVGPRPERPYFVDAFRDAFPRYDARHRVPCGLTGWAQIHGLRGDTSIEERARFDNYYIENWSLWLDAKILLRTVGSLMKGSG